MSGGSHVRDYNCERLKNSKSLYNMGMKVAAVALMCQDSRVFKAMKMAGTPCPYEGKIGKDATKAWDENPDMHPEFIEEQEQHDNKILNILSGAGAAGLLFLLFL